MKKYIIIGLIIALLGSLVVVPMLQPNEEEKLGAAFDFIENLATPFNTVIPIKINVPQEKSIQKVELFYNDTLMQEWSTPKGQIEFSFNASYYGLGAHSINLITTFEDEEFVNDQRIIRVLSDIKPDIWFVKIKNTYPHQSSSFTQGLEFNAGVLYEGTGQYGQSKVAKIDIPSGKFNLNNQLDNNFFGEGITVIGEQLFQLTWKSGKCFVYNKESLILEKEYTYSGEGWGLCNDGESIIMSDGSERLYFRDPKSFAFQKTLEVYSHIGPVSRLNELEYVDGMIYANVWMSNRIVVIEPNTGRVIAEIDGTEVEEKGRGYGDVMNGIAYNSSTKGLFLTGKNWASMFEVELEKPNF